MIDPNVATVLMLVQSDSSIAFLKALYDQSAQLLTLSTATAAIFVSLSDKTRFATRWMLAGLGVLGVSAGVAVWMMARLTNLMGKNPSNPYQDLSKIGWGWSWGGLGGLHWLHAFSLILLALGVFLFGLAKLKAH